MMGNKLFVPCAFSLAILVFHEAAGFTIRNELLGKCLQVLPDAPPRVGLGECRSGSALQEWQWLPKGQALGSLHTGECLSGHERHHSVRLHRCVPQNGAGTTGGTGDGDGRAWACSRRGHLTLLGKGLHLTARHVSPEVILSDERGLASKWRTSGNLTVCSKREDHRHHRRHGSMQSTAQPVSAREGEGSPTTTEIDPETELSHLTEISTPEGPSVTFFTTEYGFGWKVVMLVLSSMALVLGTVILTLNINQSRKKKPACVLKTYIPVGGASQPGSPVPSERAPLTQDPVCPGRSPALQRGEILVEWKDGTVTPLFNNSYLTD